MKTLLGVKSLGDVNQTAQITEERQGRKETGDDVVGGESVQHDGRELTYLR